MADLNVIKPQQVQRMINKFCCTIGMLPTSYKASLTYEEQILAIGHYLETVVYPAINQNAEALEELQGLFIALQDYVNNYFDNLDVQTEINNKIDEMVESGDFQEIILNYINVTINYNTYEEMITDLSTKDLSNLLKVKTLGYHAINDNGGANYLITNTPNAYNGFKIDLNNNGFYLILLNPENIKQFGAYGDNIHNDLTAFNNAITTIDNIFINCGTYKIDGQIIVNKRGLNLIGESKNNTILNTNEPILFNNFGTKKIYLTNFTLNGTNKINDGIEIYTDVVMADQYPVIENIEISNCKTGIYTHSDYNSSAIKGIRIDKVDIHDCINGIDLKDTSDDFIYNCTSYLNIENGFKIKGGNHKIEMCKAYFNGIGYADQLEDAERIPINAFVATEDNVYNPEKTYYVKNESQYVIGESKMTEFTGSSFQVDVTYYELVNTGYKKRFSGFYLDTFRCTVANCEAQDNYGDGFYIKGFLNNLNGITGDNNGILGNIFENQILSYASQGLTQLYSGVYLYHNYNSTVSGIFANYRQAQYGKHQKSSIYFDTCNTTNGIITSNNQVQDVEVYTTVQLNLVNNNNYYTLKIKLDTLQFQTGFSLLNSSMNRIELNGNNLEIYVIVNSANSLTHDDASHEIFRLPAYLVPSNNTMFEIYMDNVNGYNIKDKINGLIGGDRKIYYRCFNTQTDYRQMIIHQTFKIN